MCGPAFAPASEQPRALETYLPEVHVALSACESDQISVELPIGGGYRGVFSAMLQRALATLGPEATYRDLLGAASAGVRDRVLGQYPVGYATQPEDLHQLLFGGAVQMRRSQITLENHRGTWPAP